MRLFYNDEHAMLLGIRTASQPVSPFVPTAGSVAGAVANPQVGDPTATDPSGRPFFPSLFITDITDDPDSRAGDWQFGGTPMPPTAVFGTWKGGTRSGADFALDKDPAKNDYDLDGTGTLQPDPVPAGLENQGYGSEVRWDVNALVAAGKIQTGRLYRMQVMVHDGDQNKDGGDVGQACALVSVTTVPPPPPSACPPPTGQECTSGIVGFLLRYTGPARGATTLTFTGSNGASVTYTLASLTPGTVLVGPPDDPFTLDATKHGGDKLGTKTNVLINGTLTEVFHTSCSCKTNNFIPGLPACLDSSSPDNPSGQKGEPSPLFTVVNFK